VPLFPARLFAFATGIIVFAALLAYRPRRRTPGQVFWLYLVLAGKNLLQALGGCHQLLPHCFALIRRG
jgi:hypothetical protein